MPLDVRKSGRLRELLLSSRLASFSRPIRLSRSRSDSGSSGCEGNGSESRGERAGAEGDSSDGALGGPVREEKGWDVDEGRRWSLGPVGVAIALSCGAAGRTAGKSSGADQDVCPERSSHQYLTPVPFWYLASHSGRPSSTAVVRAGTAWARALRLARGPVGTGGRVATDDGDAWTARGAEAAGIAAPPGEPSWAAAEVAAEGPDRPPADTEAEVSTDAIGWTSDEAVE